MPVAKKVAIEVDGQDVQRQWDESGAKTDWSAFPHGYGILLNERLIFPQDLSLWRIKLDHTRQLFVDDYLIAHISNLKREFHRPQDHPANPVLSENYRCWPAYFAEDPKEGYRLYYHTAGRLLHLAYSKDGINWDKPELDVHDISAEPERFPGGPNNVVASGEIHGLFHEPADSDPQQRWKAIIRGGAKVNWPHRGVDNQPIQGQLLALYTSADGIRWNYKTDVGLVAGKIDFRAPYLQPTGISDVLRVRWDPKLKKYMANCKHTIGPDLRLTPVFHAARVVTVCESDDLIHWSAPRVYAYPDGEDAKLPGMYGIYEADGFVYESMWLNCFSMSFYHAASKEEHKRRNLIPTRPYLKRNWIRLAGSRDGRNWYYLAEREPFIELGSEDSWKPHYLRMANLHTIGGPLLKNDELRFYYRGTMNEGPRKSCWREAIGLATLRRDGFASLNAGREPGIVITRPLVFEGQGDLYVNAEVAKGGYLQVAAMDESGQVIQGFSQEDCRTIAKDATRSEVTWKGGQTLAKLKDRYIRLAFYFRQSKLYSFWIE